MADGECEECRKKQTLQRASLSSRGRGIEGEGEVPPIVHEILHSPGQPLDATTRAFMEPRFGQDFSQVRLHTDPKAADSAQAVNALAYTIGHDVVFGPGQYAPETIAGKQVLAHELTHVVQQTKASNQTLLQRLPKDQTEPHPLPLREAMEATERGLYEEYVNNCNGVRVLSRLERQAPLSPVEKVRRLEDRLKYIRIYFRKESSSVGAEPSANDLVNSAALRCVKDCIFGKDYALLSEDGELAITQCELSEARWQSFAFAGYGQIPGIARSLHLGKVPWIPDPRVCFNPTRLDEIKKGFEEGRGCDGEPLQKRELIL